MNDNKEFENTWKSYRDDQVWTRNDPPKVGRTFYSKDNTLWQVQANYSREFNGHNIDAMLLFEESTYKGDNFNGKKELSIPIDQVFAGNADNHLGGRDIYEKLIKGYTEKQWGRKCTELPAFIIKRLPFRFVYDNNYFNDRYQGIPVGGYTAIVEKMLEGTEVRTGIDFFEFRKENSEIAEKIIFTGMIDEYFGYQLGALEYRSVRFETEVLDCENYQGNAVVNYTEREVPYTRIIEHKHFEFGKQEKTVISREYSSEWSVGMEPYYPVNDEKNNALFEEYKKLAEKEENVIFGGRLGDYKYYDMDKVVAAALDRLEEFN